MSPLYVYDYVVGREQKICHLQLAKAARIRAITYEVETGARPC